MDSEFRSELQEEVQRLLEDEAIRARIEELMSVRDLLHLAGIDAKINFDRQASPAELVFKPVLQLSLSEAVKLKDIIANRVIETFSEDNDNGTLHQ
jgi:hypothetical protein